MKDGWIDVRTELPEKADIYEVCRDIHAIPTFAMYSTMLLGWQITINNTYWQIEGVQYWRHARKTPKAMRDARPPNDRQ